MARLLRAIGYSPCACNSIARMTDIIHDMPRRDARALIGAQKRSAGAQWEERKQVDEYWALAH
eukprot:8268258-Pyramimonas_sp.AAC.1